MSKYVKKNKIMAKLKGKKIKNGIIYCDDSLKLIQTKEFLRKYEGKIDLVFTSPPFPLNSQKKYGNKKGNEYVARFIFNELEKSSS